jgi:leader peptidase (prepilin peptidase)/N-methyltransferase
VADVPTAVLAAFLGVLGLTAGVLINRAAGRFPWGGAQREQRRGTAVRPPGVELGTAVLCALAALRFGASAELPAFVFLTLAGVLLAVIDLQHRLLPDRVVLPSLGIGALLLAVAAFARDDWPALGRAALGAGVLFGVFLVLARIAPAGMGMGDVKLAALLGLYLGWLGWGAVLLGAVAGFVVQAVLALVLLASRRVGLRSELPFGPAMLLGAALVIGWTGAIVGSATSVG